MRSSPCTELCMLFQKAKIASDGKLLTTCAVECTLRYLVIFMNMSLKTDCVISQLGYRSKFRRIPPRPFVRGCVWGPRVDLSTKNFPVSTHSYISFRMYLTKAFFSCDLRDFQYPFVCVTYFRIVGIIFHSATRHVLVESITRREDKSKDCRKIRIIEQVKRYG